MTEVITMGEALIDFVPQQVDCKLKEVSDFHRAPGGAPANVAVGLSRLGGESGFMGKVGNDAFGEFMIDTLRENNVDISQMVQTDKAMTTLAFVSLRSDGERDFAFYRKPGADMLYRSADIDFSYLDNAKMFHFGSISLINEPAKTTTLDLIEYARKKEVLVSYDPNLRPPLWPSLERAKKQIEKTIPLADILKINEDELAFLTGIDPEIAKNKANQQKIIDACKQIYESGPELVVVTLGAAGSFYYSGENYGYVDGKDVKAIDTTGAGDGFVAGMLYKLLNNIEKKDITGFNKEDWQEVLGFANYVGAITSTRNGGIPSLPYMDELKGNN